MQIRVSAAACRLARHTPRRRAGGELIHPKSANPMHYGANPLDKGTPEELLKALGDAPVKVLPPKPGESAQF